MDENTNNILIDNCEFSDGNGDWKYWRMKATGQDFFYPNCTDLNKASGNRGLEKGGSFCNGKFLRKGLNYKKLFFS